MNVVDYYSRCNNNEEIYEPTISNSNDDNNSPNKNTTMIPVAQCIGSVDDDTVAVQSVEDQWSLPVANYVTTMNEQTLQSINWDSSSDEVQAEAAEVMTGDNDYFTTPSVQSFVTPENERANMVVLGHTHPIPGNDSNNGALAVQPYVAPEHERATSHMSSLLVGPTNTITGDELLSRLKKHRKKATMRSGIIGGIVGLIFLGPIGALGIGAGSAAITKHRLKRREKSLRRQLDGRLNQPLPVLSNMCSHNHRCSY